MQTLVLSVIWIVCFVCYFGRTVVFWEYDRGKKEADLVES